MRACRRDCVADAVARVDQQDRDVGRRRAGRHVARVLLVARRVGEDELAPRRGEVAVGDVDGDALLALGACRPSVNSEKSIGPAVRFFDAFSTECTWSS